MLPLNVTRLNAAYYTGNCHKWLCAPKGAGFLHVRRDRAANIHPLRISLGYASGKSSDESRRPRLWREFDWSGTEDPTPALCVPEAISFLGSLLPGGWDELRSRNRSLALEGRQVLLETLGLDAPCPASMVGSMAAVVLPGPAGEPTALGLDPLQEALYARHGIEVPVVPWPPLSARLLRISAQVYNTRQQYQALAGALNKLLA
jgi:isopenicillin-N epimerase